MSTTEKIARLRARFIVRHAPRRAAELLVAAGVAVRDAVCFVLDLLAAMRRQVRFA